jgi:2-oxoglutarate dehydrogenase E2 component (dihydrolipoamide succinyltransferase)
MLAEVKVPEVGESITEGTLVQWFKKEGEIVRIDDPLFELETDKVTLEVPSEYAGKIRPLVPEGETVHIGQVVATIDTDAAEEADVPTQQPAAEATTPPAASSEGPPISPPAGLPQAGAKVAAMADRESLSPAVRRMVEEFKLDPGAIAGTGRDGRITKEDVVRHLESLKAPAARPEPVAAKAAPPAVPAPAAAPPAAAPRPGERETRKPMSPLRQRIAERLVEAKQTTAMLTTFNEADMTNIFAWREKHKQAFKVKHDISLGFMSFFVKASVDALKEIPQLNARIEGDEIVENHYYDIGVAISSDKGLVVPVVRDADTLSFAGVESAIADLAERVRTKKITLADLSGAVFTISNGGVFGSLLSTPILNPPQSGILGMHAIKKRPIVVDDEIVIRPMMYLALSYDHRIVDGREAVTFLKRIVECVENPERMMLEV